MINKILSDKELESVVGGKEVKVVEVTLADTGERGYMPLDTYKTMTILPDGRVQPPKGAKSDDYDFAPATYWKDICAEAQSKHDIQFTIVKP